MLVCAAQTGPEPAVKRHASPAELLNIAHQAEADLIPSERALHLVALILAAAPMKHPATEDWVKETLALAEQLPASWNRQAIQKNAVVALSAINPRSAMDAFALLQDPIVMEDGSLPEDLRADAARDVFERFWKKEGPKGLDQIRNQARRVGETGQYPFKAMVPIIQDLAAQDSETAEAILGESVFYYGKSRKSGYADQEYIEYLFAIRDIMPRPMWPQALTAVADRLMNGDKPKGESFLAQVHGQKGSTSFKNKQDYLLAKLLPLIHEGYPQLAERIVEKRKDLAQMDNVAGQTAAADTIVIKGDATADRIMALQSRGLERSRLENVMRLASADPEQALRYAGTLTDVSNQATALAAIARGLQETQPGRAAELFRRSGKLVAESKAQDPEAKLRALVEIARTAGALGRADEVASSVQRAMDIGEEAFEQDRESAPGRPAYESAGFDALNDTIRVGARYCHESTIALISSLNNPVLKAYFWIAAAQGLADKKH